MNEQHMIYLTLVKTLEEYLGPTSDRFVRRQISAHLKIDPESVRPEDVPKIAEWIKVSLGAITPDKKVVDEAYSKVLDISKKSA